MGVALDGKNAFNSANWSRIKKSLATIGVLIHLVSIVTSYFQEWISGIFVGMLQGSLLSPPGEEATVVGSNADIALILVAKHLKDAKLY